MTLSNIKIGKENTEPSMQGETLDKKVSARYIHGREGIWSPKRAFTETTIIITYKGRSLLVARLSEHESSNGEKGDLFIVPGYIKDSGYKSRRTKEGLRATEVDYVDLEDKEDIADLIMERYQDRVKYGKQGISFWSPPRG